MSDSPVSLYFVLGASGSERRRVLADLITAGLAPGDRAAVLLSRDEAAAPFDDLLRAAPATVSAWSWEKPDMEIALPEEATHIFLVADGRRNPVDQVEALRDWLKERPDVRLARLLFVANAALAHAQPALEPWFEACAHFSDVVLVTKAEGIEGKWVTAFAMRFRERHFPALCEVVRDGKVKNPALILAPEARRVAQVFDEEMELADESDEEIEAAKPENDRYFAKKQGGSRVVDLPDIAAHL